MSEIDLKLARDGFVLDAAFTLADTGITGVFGASGCGKTTLLRCIAGLERGSRGTVRVQGDTWQDADSFVPTHRRAVGYVFQEPRLFPHLTVAGNLAYAERRSGGGAVDHEHIVELLGIGPLLARKPARLSGGERQRAAIARALLRKPAIVLMDEPLANLDAARKREILPFLDRLHGEIAVPIVYVSHSLDEITHLCDHLVVLDAGRVAAAGALNEVLLRGDLPLPAGEEASVVLEACVDAYDAGYELTQVSSAAGTLLVPGRHGAPGTRLRLRILARDVSLTLAPPVETTILNVLPVTVVAVQAGSGGWVMLELAAGAARLLARVSRRSAEMLDLTPGSAAFAQLKGVAVRNH